MRRQQAMQDYYAPKKPQRQPQKTRGRYRTPTSKNVVTVQQGDTLPSLAEKAGVDEKDITGLGVKQPIPGQVLDLTSATKQKEVAANYAKFKQIEAIDQQLYELDQQGRPTGRGLRGAGAGPVVDWEKRRAELQAQRDALTAGFTQIDGTPTPQAGPAAKGAGTGSQLYGEGGRPILQETTLSKILNWGAVNPDRRYSEGFSPADEAAWQERQQFRSMQERWQALHPEAGQDISPTAQPYAQSISPSFTGGQPAEGQPFSAPSEMAMEGGRYVKDGRGNYVWIGDPGTPPTDFQRVVDSQAASLSMRAIDYAIANELWDRLPTSISPGASAMMIGHTILLGGDPNQKITLDLETLSMLGYSMNDAGALIHEEVDTDIPFSAGYGDYTGGYGGGGGGGGGYEEKTRYYTGGNVGETSGKFARGGSQRYQHLGVGTANWRI